MGSDGSVQLLKPIEFETGRATIKPVSFPILDEVLDLLKSRPSMRLGVYGHTDSKGTAPNNLRLSKERAAAVRITCKVRASPPAASNPKASARPSPSPPTTPTTVAPRTAASNSRS